MLKVLRFVFFVCTVLVLGRSVAMAAEVRIPIDFYVNYPQNQPDTALRNSKVGLWDGVVHYLAVKASDTSALASIPPNATITDIRVHFGAPLAHTSNDFLCWPLWFVNDSTDSLLAASYNRPPSGFTVSVGGGNQCIGVTSFHDITLGPSRIDQLQNAILFRNYSQPLPGYELNPADTYYVVTYTAPPTTATATSAPTATPTTAPTSTTCPPSGSSGRGIATAEFTLDQPGNYKAWISMKGGGDGANSIWLQLDNLYCVKVGDLAGMPANIWSWVDYQNGATANKIPMPLLGTGAHTITLIGNGSEPGVGVDRILLTRDTECVPTGSGDACIGLVSTPTVTNTPTAIPTSVQTIGGPTIVTSSLPQGKVGQPYTAYVAATSPGLSNVVGMTATGLPPGLMLQACTVTSSFGGTNLSCPIIGTPSKNRAYSPKFTVTDSSGHFASKTLKLQVR